MLGAVIGDIVGNRWEFNPTNDYNFDGLSSQNCFTDDTICTEVSKKMSIIFYDEEVYFEKFSWRFDR